MKKYNKEKKKEPKKKTIPKMRKDFEIIDHDAIIFDKDSKQVLAVYLKQTLNRKMIEIGRNMIAFKRKGVRKSISNSDVPIWTTLLGRSFPKYVPPGYLSPASKQNLELFHGDVKVFMRYLERYMKKYVPHDYYDMKKLSRKIPKDHQIGDAWHNFQVNYDYRSRYHKDAQDTSQYSIVCPFYNFDGAEIVLPAYQVVFPAKEGDIVLMNQHEIHGNLPLKKGHRLSVIPYTHAGFNHYRKQVVPRHK